METFHLETKPCDLTHCVEDTKIQARYKEFVELSEAFGEESSDLTSFNPPEYEAISQDFDYR